MKLSVSVSLPLAVPLAVLLAALLAARSAAAQDPPPRDPVDDATVRFGPVGLTPVLNFQNIGRDNNVFNTATDPKSDFTATISPKLDVLVHPGPVLLTLTTASDYIYFQTYKSERATNATLSARADFTFGPVKPFISASGTNAKDRVNREIDARAQHRDRGYEGGATVHIFEGLFASASARQATRTFDDDAEFRGESLADTLNGRMEAYDASVGVNVTPLTAVSVAYGQQHDRFDRAPERNADSWRILPTVTFSPLAVLNGSAALGYRHYTPHDPQVPPYDGFVATLTLGTTAFDGHRFDVTFGRDIQYSYEGDTVYYLETGIQGSWSWQISNAIDLRLTGSRSRLNYQSASLTDATDDDIATSYGGSLGWRLREHLRASVNADWRGRDSERSADRGFENRRIYATVTWGKQ